jgi:hypothetical protein
MADVNYGLLESLRGAVKSPIDYVNQSAQTDLTRAQTNYANTQAKTNQQDLALKKLSTLNQLAGSVMLNPTQENLMAAKKLANMAGIETHDIPDEIHSAMPLIQNAYVSSGQALEQMKAQAQISMAQATLGLKATDTAANIARTNLDAQDKGLPTPFLGQSQGGIQGFPSLGIPLNPGSRASIASSPNTTPVNAQSTANAMMPTVAPSVSTGGAAQAQYPGLQNNPVMFPAERKGQEEQVKNWEDTKKAMGASSSAYIITKNTIQDAVDANNKRNFGSVAGFVPNKFIESTPENQRLAKDAQYLFQGLIKSLSASGISRLDIPIVKAVMGSLPEPGKYSQINTDILNKLYAANEIVGNIAPKVIQTLDQQGIRDPLAAQNLINQVVEKTGAYNNQSGSIDLNRLNNWQKQFYDILDPRTGTNPANGQTYSYGDFYTAAKKQDPKISDQEINQTWQSQLLNSQQQSTQPPAANQPAQQMSMNQNNAGNDQRLAQAQQHAPQLAEAIARGIESGGNYNAIGNQTSGGDRAYGKYQVMGKNIPTWTREVFGKPMTPKEFLANPQAQDAVAYAKLAQYIAETGSLEDAASKWFSGKPAKNNLRRDVNGTTVPKYVNAVGNTYANR